MGKTFYTGTHEVSWLERTEVPLFVSRRRLALRKRLPKAKGPWALDSGGYSELSLFGTWKTSPEQYVDEVRRYMAEIGNLQWAAIQDWMTEPNVLAMTGLKVADHQRLTIENFFRLRDLAPEVPWAPVLQGWYRFDHERHLRLYQDAGVDLKTFPVVGVGTMCRRQGEIGAAIILEGLHDELGDRLHGFGLKLRGLRMAEQYLHTADSLAWSFQARRHRREVFAEGGEKNLQNDIGYALDWREDLLASLPQNWNEAA